MNLGGLSGWMWCTYEYDTHDAIERLWEFEDATILMPMALLVDISIGIRIVHPSGQSCEFLFRLNVTSVTTVLDGSKYDVIINL